MARSEVYSDIGPEEFERRVEKAHAVLGDGDEDAIDWFRRHVGRTRAWMLARLRGDSEFPRYAATVLRKLELEAKMERQTDPLGPRSPRRAAGLADEIQEVRESLEGGAAAVFAGIETAENVLRELVAARKRIHRAFASISSKMKRAERKLRSKAGTEGKVDFGDREENEGEAREIARKGS
jgi:hypothetical protein